jgi:hypothetical protein
MVKGQMAAQDERSSEACLHCEINDLVQEHVEGQETVDVVALAANLGREPGGGLVVMPDGFMTAHRAPIISAAARNNVPAVYR